MNKFTKKTFFNKSSLFKMDFFVNRRIVPNSIKIVLIRSKGKYKRIYLKPSRVGPISIGFAFTNGENKKNKILEINSDFT